MNLCGNPWCTVKHTSANPRRKSCCDGVWRSRSRKSNPMAMKLHPIAGHAGSVNDRPMVFVDFVGKLREMWSQPPGGWRGCGAVMSTDDVREMATLLLAAADWADEQTALAQAQQDAQVL